MRFNNTQKIDYSTLTETDRHANKHGYNKSLFSLLAVPYILVALVAVFEVGDEKTIALFIFWIPFVLLPLLLSIYVYLNRKKYLVGENLHSDLSYFSELNNFEFKELEKIHGTGSIYIFQNVGDTQNIANTLDSKVRIAKRKAHNMVTGYFDDLVPFRYYTLKEDYDVYKVGSKYKHQSVMEIKLSQNNGHFFINSRLEGSGAGGSGVTPYIKNAEFMELEGDFSKYFDVFYEDGYNIDTLRVLAPDIMVTLMEFGIDCDIEVIEDTMYFYWGNEAISQEDYAYRFEPIKIILKKVWHKLGGEKVAHSNENESLLSLRESILYRKPKHKYRSFDYMIGALVVFGTLAIIYAIRSYNFSTSSEDKYGINYFDRLKPFVFWSIVFIVFYILLYSIYRAHKIELYYDYKKAIDKANPIITEALRYSKNPNVNTGLQHHKKHALPGWHYDDE